MMADQNAIHNARSVLEEFGSPCYVFHSDDFTANYRAHEKALKAAYSKYEVAYSFKTNYAPRICELIKSLGGYAEVVSDMEYCFAKKLNYDNAHIIYNGPCKGPLLEEHIAGGGIVNIDSLDELSRVLAIAEKNPEKIVGRALLWTLEDGSKMMDMIYYIKDSDRQLFLQYGKENGWVCRDDRDFYKKTYTIFFCLMI